MLKICTYGFPAIADLKQDLEDVANFKGSRAEVWLMMYCKQTISIIASLKRRSARSAFGWRFVSVRPRR